MSGRPLTAQELDAALTEFYVTFGRAHVPHPTLPMAHPDGWVTIVAEDELEAWVTAVALLGQAWSSMYDTQPDRSLFCRGELYRVERERGELRVSLPGHSAGCWREHDNCALRRAEEVLTADQSSLLRQAQLTVVSMCLRDHEQCPCVQPPGQCHGVLTARLVLEQATAVVESSRAQTVVELARCILTLSDLTDGLAKLAADLAELAEALQREIEAGA